VARQRAEGAEWTFAPFSSTVGALVVPPNSAIKALPDLKGKKLGIAGSPLDKSWLILKAHAKKQFGFDLDKVVTKAFGAPSLIAEQLKQGQIDAMLNFWPFVAKAEATGMRRILGVEDAVKALGITAAIPFVGYVFSEKWAKANAKTLDGFLAATRQAQARLDQADDLWSELKPLMGAADDAELAALKTAYRHGIIQHWGTAEQSALERLYAILAEIGGPPLVGPAQTIPAGTFWQQGAP
jgi:NitT/TauT family transport system substrate-binding protein